MFNAINNLMTNLYINGLVLGASVSEGATNVIENITSSVQNIVSPLAILALIVCGIGYIVSGRQGAEQSKEMFKRILIGVVIVYAATSIVTFLVSTAQTAFK